jgi:SOS response regulatory protein OraA/RecX
VAERVDVLQKAVELLRAREKTAQQLAQALAQRGYDEAEVERALAHVRRLGYLDDRRVAASRARQGLTERRSRAEVVRRLTSQGVDPSVAVTAVEVAAAEAGQTDEAAARALLATRKAEGAKAARLLASRGFDEALIAKLVDLEDESL